MIEHYNTWNQHCKSVLRNATDSWQPSAKIDLEEGNPIYAIYNPLSLKALRVIYGSTSDIDAYAMWIKQTSMDKITDDLISEYVFRYRCLDDVTLEAFRIFYTIWISPDTDQQFMKSLVNRFQRTDKQLKII